MYHLLRGGNFWGVLPKKNPPPPALSVLYEAVMSVLASSVKLDGDDGRSTMPARAR